MVTDLASSDPWKFTVEGNVMVSLVDADFFRESTLLSRDVESLFQRGTPDSASCTAAWPGSAVAVHKVVTGSETTTKVTMSLLI